MCSSYFEGLWTNCLKHTLLEPMTVLPVKFHWNQLSRFTNKHKIQKELRLRAALANERRKWIENFRKHASKAKVTHTNTWLSVYISKLAHQSIEEKHTS